MKVPLPKTTNSHNGNNKMKIKITSNKIKIKKPIKRCRWDPEIMKLAIEAVNSNDINPTEAAKVYQVPRQTLVDRINGKFGKEGAGRNSELTHDEEQVLVHYCLFMAKMSQPLSVAHIKAFVWAIAKKSSRKSRFNETAGPGWKWWKGFHNRHPEITLRKPDNLDRGWSHMNNQNVMNQFFALYKELLDETGLTNKPAHIFNADESRVDLNSKAGKVLVHLKSKHAYSEQKAF